MYIIYAPECYPTPSWGELLIRRPLLVRGLRLQSPQTVLTDQAADLENLFLIAYDIWPRTSDSCCLTCLAVPVFLLVSFAVHRCAFE